MTALRVPARPEEDTSLRPVPWRRMAWVTWRQHRSALTGVAALLGALAVCLWLVGSSLHHAYTAAAACRPAGSAICYDMFSSFRAGAARAVGAAHRRHRMAGPPPRRVSAHRPSA